MSRTLICHVDALVTMDSDRREITDGAIFLEGNVIKDIGTTEDVESRLENKGRVTVIDASGCVVLPGLINCHHHLNEVTTRALATGPGHELLAWLDKLSPYWGENTNEFLYSGAKTGLCELILSGATTVADESFCPIGTKFDCGIKAAQELGVRFHCMRGYGDSLQDEKFNESVKDVLDDCKRLIEEYHDPEEFAMTRIGLGPTRIGIAPKESYIEAAKLARSYKNVLLHTHYQESLVEEELCQELNGCSQLEFIKSTDWYGKDVWYAHCVHLTDEDIKFMRDTNTGMSYNASSNMILGSGISPVLKLLDEGVRIGIGVDGSSSGDSNNLLLEARQAMLLQRVQQNADKMSARKALELATRGGASILARNDIGSLEIGKAADVVAFRVDGLIHAGAQGDIVSALLTCAPANVWLSVINGRIIVKDGVLLGVDIDDLAKRCNEASREMIKRVNNRQAKL